MCPKDNPHPLTNQKNPVVMGHEFCGWIKETSPDSRHQAGQAVVVDPRYWCGKCLACQDGKTNLCASFGFQGLSGGGGGLSELTIAHDDNVYPIPADKIHLGALVEPLAVAWHGVSRAGFSTLDDSAILVLGGGPIGLAVCIILRTRGAKTVFVSEPSEARRELAASFADVVMDPRHESVSGKIREATQDRGVDLVMDCAGVQAGMDEGLNALKIGGTYLNVAGWTTAVSRHISHLICSSII